MRRMLVVIFALLLWLPIVEMATTFVKIAPLSENRNRARLPTLSDFASGASTAYQVSEAWFSDHYGFRDFLIRLKTEFDYRVFRTSDRLYLGTGDWMHYKKVLDRNIPLIEAMSQGDLDSSVAALVRLRDYLARRGITLILICAPIMERMHPESVPSDAPQPPAQSKMIPFRKALTERFGPLFIDPMLLLAPIAQERAVYNKTDWHWNDIGNYEVSRALVDTIARLDGRPVPYWRDPLDVAPGKLYGGESRELPLFHPIIEIGPRFLRPWDIPTPTRPMAIDSKIPNYLLATRLPEGVREALPTTVAYGDSFLGQMLRAGMPNYFRVFYLSDVNTPIKTVLSDLPPGTKYFVYEFFEPRVQIMNGLIELPDAAPAMQ